MRGKGFLFAVVLVLAGCGSVTDEAPESEPSVSAVSPTTTLSEESGTSEQAEQPGEEAVTPGDSALDAEGGNSQSHESQAVPTDDPTETSTAQDSGALALQATSSNPGFLVGERFTADGREYRRLVMPSDYDSIVDMTIIARAGLDMSDEDVYQALIFTGRFASEELATSELAFNYTEEGALGWLEEHSDLFIYPDRAEAGLLSTEAPSESLALLYTDNGWGRGSPESTTRVENLRTQLADIEQDGEQLIITHTVSFDAEVSGPGGLEGTFREKTRLRATYTVEKVDGKWKIADYATQWDTRY